MLLIHPIFITRSFKPEVLNPYLITYSLFSCLRTDNDHLILVFPAFSVHRLFHHEAELDSPKARLAFANQRLAWRSLTGYFVASCEAASLPRASEHHFLAKQPVLALPSVQPSAGLRTEQPVLKLVTLLVL
ncbi:hypothetical protein V511_12815 [Mesotoga sp. Brook.08.YT.4.2.5.1]|nr:hypothetical protein V511_12815 [Mesotoga sp. Brook.08.YT.4.2.5.1]